MRKLNVLLFMSLILLLTDCREPFLPDFETGKNDYLVVEGYINIGPKAVTTITLSRVSPLLGTSQVFENNAMLFIESKNGAQYQLQNNGDGKFSSDSLNLDSTTDYRLLIITENDDQYASDFSKPKTTPAIDSIHWQWLEAGIQIYVSTHDPENNTWYYKWDFVETWEIHSSHESEYFYNQANGLLEERSDPFKNDLYFCWSTADAEDLRFASSQQLEADAINYPLTLFGHYTDRSSVKYSILVEQRALSKEEFEYLQLIQKNSTITGSLFDPLPSEIRGNIQSTSNTDEKVIGYIGAYSTTSKRFFVTAAELGIDPQAKCDLVEVSSADFGSLFGSGLLIPVDSVRDGGIEIGLVYSGAPAYCMDCKLRGGVPNRPDFW